MKTVVVHCSANGVQIGVDTLIELHHAQHSDQKIFTSFLGESLFYSKRYRLAIAFIGKSVLGGVLFESLLQAFVEHLDQQQIGDQSIQSFGTDFYHYFKQHWNVIYNDILENQQIIFLHVTTSGHVQFYRKYFQLEEGFWQAADEAQVLEVIRGQSLHIKPDGALVGPIGQTVASSIVGYLNFSSSMRPPTSVLTINHSGELVGWERGFDEHQLPHLDDFVWAVKQGHFGGEMHPPFVRNQLDLVIGNGVANLETITGFRRQVPYCEFLKFCRSEVSIKNFGFFQFYRQVYHFINKVCRENPIFSFKFAKVIDNQVQIIIRMAGEDAEVSQVLIAYYVAESNMLFVYVDRMLEFGFKQAMRIFMHEIEHAFINCMHKKRWLNEEVYDPEHQSMFTQRLHNQPYFPYTKTEAQKFFALVKLGFSRVVDLIELLKLPASRLSPDQVAAIAHLRDRLKDYVPSIHLDLFNKTSEEDGLPESGTFKINSYVLRFKIVGHKIVPGQGNRYALKQQFAEGLDGAIADIFKQYQDHQHDAVELEARFVGELSTEVLGFFFPELIEYIRADIRAAFDEVPAEYDQLLTIFDDAFRRQLFGDEACLQAGLFRVRQVLLDGVEQAVLGEKPFARFLDLLRAGKNNVALRELCHLTSPKVVNVLRLLFAADEKIKFEVNDKPSSGKTALYRAIESGQEEVYQFLLTQGADSTVIIEGKSIAAHAKEKWPSSLVSSLVPP